MHHQEDIRFTSQYIYQVVFLPFHCLSSFSCPPLNKWLKECGHVASRCRGICVVTDSSDGMPLLGSGELGRSGEEGALWEALMRINNM